MYSLYWIRKQNHTDIMTQGYIGITKDFNNRMKSHKKNKNKTPLTDSIKTYGWNNLIKQIVLSGLDLESALILENVFRPTSNTGWNLQVGGELGVGSSWYENENNRIAHSKATSEATKRGIALRDSRENRAMRARNNWSKNRESYKNVSKGSNNPRAILTEDDVRKIKYDTKYINLNSSEIAEIFHVRKHVIQQIRSGKNWKHI